MTFEQFTQAWKVFSGDYGIVGHSDLLPRSPFEEPNEGTYSLTQLSKEISEEDFLSNLKEVETIVVSCMDKDMAHPVWKQVQSEKQRTIFMISAAGGVVQKEGARQEAMKTIATYLLEKAQEGAMPKLSGILLMDHNHTCGAVKFWSNDEALVDLITRVTGEEAALRGKEENKVMNALIREGAKVWEGFKRLPGVAFGIGLFDTQRHGEGGSARIVPITSEGDSLSVAELQDAEKVSRVVSSN